MQSDILSFAIQARLQGEGLQLGALGHMTHLLELEEVEIVNSYIFLD